MNIRIDTHSHTLASGHAYNTLREMAAMAAEKGLEGLAVTEHAPEMPGSCQLYYFQNLRVVPRTLYNIHLLLGTELNIMDREGNVDLPQGVIRDLDIAIASLHTPCFKDERTQENVMQAYLSVMENPYIDIIGHPDDGRFPADYEVLAREAKRTGTLLEVNNSSLRPDGYRANGHCRISFCRGTGKEDSFSGRAGGKYFLREIDFPVKTQEKGIDFKNSLC